MHRYMRLETPAPDRIEAYVLEASPLTLTQGARYLTGHHEPWLVALSLLIAATASFAAVDLASRVTATTGEDEMT
jgi:hypothetical protein